ncbi:MAG: permease [Archaeoglobaceae archaeon]
MNFTVIFINSFVLVCFIAAVLKDRSKTRQALKVAVNAFFRILPMVLAIVVLIGLILGFVPPDQISRFIGEQSGFIGVLIVGVVGAVLHIPALISFPLASSLLDAGASVTAVATFITTLTMIGTVTLPLEIKELGKEMALLRNGVSFFIAITIALIMGAIL